MSIFHFPKYFWLFLIFHFFLFFLKNKNKGEHILFVVFTNVSISFFPDFPGFPQISLFFSCQRFTKMCQRFTKMCQRFTKTCQRFTKKCQCLPFMGIPFFGFFSLFSLFFGVLDFFGVFGSNFFSFFFYFIFLVEILKNWKLEIGNWKFGNLEFCKQKQKQNQR